MQCIEYIVVRVVLVICPVDLASGVTSKHRLNKIWHYGHIALRLAIVWKKARERRRDSQLASLVEHFNSPGQVGI